MTILWPEYFTEVIQTASVFHLKKRFFLSMLQKEEAVLTLLKHFQVVAIHKMRDYVCTVFKYN